MLPICKRTVSVPRKDISPVWTRSFPISKQPETLGQHLRKKRFDSGLRQTEVARRLAISNRTLSCWECDRIYPTWEYWPRIIGYLGYDPFTEPSLGSRKCNETRGVAFSSLENPVTLGKKLVKRRLELRKNRLKCAVEMGVSVKTLCDWERDRRSPNKHMRASIVSFLGYNPFTN
jgi:transcriptional regulator with XRE-family HTH domain